MCIAMYIMRTYASGHGASKRARGVGDGERAKKEKKIGMKQGWGEKSDDEEEEENRSERARDERRGGR